MKATGIYLIIASLLFTAFVGILAPSGPPIWPASAEGTRSPEYVIVTEVIPDPDGSDTYYEWIEVYNAGSESVNMSGWKVWERGTNHTISSTAGNMKPIAPNEYGVIADNPDDFLTVYPWYSGPLYKAGLSILNSGQDNITLYNGSVAVDFATFNSSHTAAGNSLEVINITGDNNASSNWAASLQHGGTPGYRNSVYDDGTQHVPSITAVNAPQAVFANESAVITATVDPSTVTSVQLYYQVDGGGYTSIAMVDDGTGPDAVAGDGNYTAKIPGQTEGKFVEYYVHASNADLSYDYPYPGSLHPRNYTVLPVENIVLNEFMPNPAQVDWNHNGIMSDSDDEYIEIYNNDTKTINISGWMLDDEEGGSTPYTIPDGTELTAGQIAVFFSNVTGVGLNNGGDSVRLLSPTGAVIDEYTYTTVGEDQSIGRMPDGGAWQVLQSPSPGLSNNWITYSPVIHSLSIEPTAPNSTSTLQFRAQVTSYTPLSTVLLNYSINGGSFSSVPMTQSTGDNFTAQIGPYPDSTHIEYYAYAVDTNGNSTESSIKSIDVRDYSTDVCINEFLAYQGSDWNGDGNVTSGDEFIELYNPTGSTVNLSGWMLDDAEVGSSPYVLPAGTEIGAGAFVVFFGSETGLSLNNNGDSVRLLTPAGSEYANITYTSSSKDVSIGLYPDGSVTYVKLSSPTPGMPNSIPMDSVPVFNKVTIDPTLPMPNQQISISANISSAFPVSAVLYYQVDTSAVQSAAMVRDATTGLYTVSIPGQIAGCTIHIRITASTSYASSYYPGPADTDTVSFTVKDQEDMDIFSLVINEVMFNPTGTEVDGEWVEVENPLNRAVNATGCTLTDLDGSVDFIFPHVTLTAGERVVIHAGKGNTSAVNGIRHFYMNKSSSFLGNSGDELLLSAPDGSSIDFVGWGKQDDVPPPDVVWDNNIKYLPPEGYTLSLIPDGNDTNSSSSWHPGEPTPGLPNIQMLDRGPVVTDVSYSPVDPSPGDSIVLSAKAVDDTAVADTMVTFRTRDWNSSTWSANSTVAAEDDGQNGDIKANDSVYSAAFTVMDEDTIVEAWFTATDNNANSTTAGPIYFLVSSYNPDIVINELLPAPASDWNGDGNATSDDEFIELYNKGEHPADLQGWVLDDIPNGSRPFKVDSFMLIAPEGFIVLFRQDTGIGLNNDGDTIILMDPEGTIRDNITYNGSQDDTSIGRYPDGGKLSTLARPTPGEPNIGVEPPRKATSEERKLLIVKVYCMERQDRDFVALFNPSDRSLDLGGFKLTDFEGEAVFLPDTIIAPGSLLYYAQSASEFYLSMHFYPDVSPAPVGDMYQSFGKGINLASSGDEVALLSPADEIIDIVVWGKSDYTGEGWSGAPVGNPGTGEILTRQKLTNRSYADTNTSVDWEGLRHYVVGQSDLPYRTFDFNGTVTTFVSPDSSYGAITELLDSATSTIYLNVYELTNYNLTKHMISALERGVNVKIFLEGAPVEGISQQEKFCLHELYLAGADIGIMYADTSSSDVVRYKFDHAKYCVVDNSSTVVTTENWAYTGVPVDPSYGNRGWGVRIDDPDVAHYFADVFFLDFNPKWNDVLPYDPNLDLFHWPTSNQGEVLTDGHEVRFPAKTITGHFTVTPIFAPDHTLMLNSGILGAIKSAKKTIYLEQLEMDIDWGLGAKFTYNWSDKSHYYLKWNDGKTHYNLYLKSVIDRARDNVSVRVILDSRYISSDPKKVDNMDTVQYLNKVAELEGLDLDARLVDLSETRLDKVHTKGIIIDNKTTLVSSINFSPYSPIYNRECGVLIENEDVASYYADVFFFDFGLSNKTTGEPGYTFYNDDQVITQNATPVIIPSPAPIKRLDKESSGAVVIFGLIQIVIALIILAGIIVYNIRSE